MKVSMIFILVSSLTLSARGLSQRISIDTKNKSVQQVFSEIESQTGYSFIYAKEQALKMKPVNIKVDNVDLISLLDLLF